MNKNNNTSTDLEPEKRCEYCWGWGSDNGLPCPDCGKEMIR